MSTSEAAELAVSTTVRKHGHGRRIALTIPFFVYFLAVFVLVEYFVPNVRTVMINGRFYTLTWVEVLYLLTTTIAMCELLRVSKPGIDNTIEALFMLGAFIAYLILYLFAVNGVWWLQIFRNTEFLMITIISGIQVVMAFIINARTLKRTIDYTNDDQHH